MRLKRKRRAKVATLTSLRCLLMLTQSVRGTLRQWQSTFGFLPQPFCSVALEGTFGESANFHKSLALPGLRTSWGEELDLLRGDWVLWEAPCTSRQAHRDHEAALVTSLGQESRVPANWRGSLGFKPDHLRSQERHPRARRQNRASAVRDGGNLSGEPRVPRSQWSTSLGVGELANWARVNSREMQLGTRGGPRIPGLTEIGSDRAAPGRERAHTRGVQWGHRRLLANHREPGYAD